MQETDVILEKSKISLDLWGLSGVIYKITKWTEDLKVAASSSEPIYSSIDTFVTPFTHLT